MDENRIREIIREETKNLQVATDHLMEMVTSILEILKDMSEVMATEGQVREAQRHLSAKIQGVDKKLASLIRRDHEPWQGN